MIKKVFVFLFFLLCLLTSINSEIFAVPELSIPDFKNRAERCDSDDYCATGNTLSTEKYGMVPNISREKLCGGDRIAVCNYDYEGIFDATNVRNCFCLKLEKDEIPPQEEEVSACVCKNGIVDSYRSNCLNDTKATCMGRADTSNPYTSETCMCLSLDSDAAAAESPPQPPGTTTSLVISTNSNEEFWCEKGKTIDTAIGCLPITVNGLVEKLLPTIFGIAGGIAFLMMVYGFILMATSSGDEKKVQAAKQIVTSAITGLLVAIFALFLYKLIAIDILHIPGINFGNG